MTTTKSPDEVTFSVNLSPAVYARLKELQRLAGLETMEETIVRALEIYLPGVAPDNLSEAKE